jgi:transcriptional regulator with XRE-family HTH domain
MAASGETPGSGRTLADKINRLFETMHPRSEGPKSNEDVAAAINAAGKTKISASYLWLLRSGKRDNPTRQHLQAIADYFGVDPSYFFDVAAAERIDAELELLAAMRDAAVRQIALRAAGLSPESLRAIAQIVERTRTLEHLPDPPAAHSPPTPDPPDDADRPGSADPLT